MGRFDRFKSAWNAGLNSGTALDEPGTPITVRPFAPGEVTPEAGIVKAITKLAAVRRDNANARQKAAEAEAARSKQALETQALTQRIAENTRSEVTLGDGTKAMMTPAERTRHQVDSVPKPDARIPLSESAASLYRNWLQTYDPEKHTVDPKDLQTAVHIVDQQGIMNRAEQYRRLRAESNGNGQKYAAALAQKRSLDLEVESEAQAAGKKAWQLELTRLEQQYGNEDSIPPIQIEKAKNRQQQAIDDARVMARSKRKAKYAEYDMVIDTAAFGSGLDAMLAKWAGDLE